MITWSILLILLIPCGIPPRRKLMSSPCLAVVAWSRSVPLSGGFHYGFLSIFWDGDMGNPTYGYAPWPMMDSQNPFLRRVHSKTTYWWTKRRKGAAKKNTIPLQSKDFWREKSWETIGGLSIAMVDYLRVYHATLRFWSYLRSTRYAMIYTNVHGWEILAFQCEVPDDAMILNTADIVSDDLGPDRYIHGIFTCW